jgi:membrane fusion protein (multidrug efflux system)
MKKQKMMRNIIVYGVAFFVFAGIGVSTYIYANYAEKTHEELKQQADELAKVEAEKQLSKVKVVEVLPVPLTDYLVLPGTVKPYAEIDLAAKSAGTVTWIGSKEGDRIKKGQSLLTIDMKSVETKGMEAQVRYEQAQKDFERIKKLYDEQIVSRNQLDAAQTALETAKVAVDSVAVTLDDGSLTSPVSGILDRLDIDAGEYVTPGRTVMRIVNIDKVKVELPIPEKDVLHFKKGQKVDIEVEDAAGEKQTFTGKIEYVALTADAANRTYPLKVVVANPKHALRPGMIVRANLVRRQLEEAIAVPFFTVVEHETSKAVFVVDQEQNARLQPIEYGTFQHGIVEIRNGLNLGDRLIIVGQRNLVDGEKVDVTDDITLLAKQWLNEGKDLSQLPLDTLQNIQ